MKKVFLFVLLFITAYCSAKDSVFLVTDEYTNIFTINGLDYYLEDNSLSIQLGDHFIVRKNEKVPLPDQSYYLVTELTHVESGVTQSFTSTVMNDSGWSTVHEIVIENLWIDSYHQTGVGGGYEVFIPRVTFHCILEDGTTFDVDNQNLKETRSLAQAEELVEEFLANFPAAVKVTHRHNWYGSSRVKTTTLDVEWLVGSKDTYHFYFDGQRRQKEKDIADSRLDFDVDKHDPCSECGEDAWHCWFEKFGHRYSFGLKNHKWAHAKYSPGHRAGIKAYFKLIHIYDDRKYGRVFVMRLFPDNKEYHLFINHDASAK